MADSQKPKDLQEINDFIFESLKRRYGNAVISEDNSDNQIVVDTQTSYLGHSDVWISLKYFH